MEAAFRERLNIDANQEAGILAMRVPANDEVLETVSS
jgi:hypothetical protein